MTIKINRFEVKSYRDGKSAIIIDHSIDMSVVTVAVHKSLKENKALAEKLIPLIETEFEDE